MAGDTKIVIAKLDSIRVVDTRADDTKVDGLDQMLKEIGMGRWQILCLVANFLIWSVLSPHTIGTTLLNADVPFSCFSDQFSLHSNFSHDKMYSFENETTTNSSKFTNNCPKSPSENFTSEMYRNQEPNSNVSGTELATCPFVEYDHSVFESTITTEWNLICERSNYRPLFQNTYTIGLIVGCAVGGDIGDRLGRARAVLIGSFVHCVGTVIVAFTTNFIALIVARFIVGITNLMILVTVVTLALETCPEKYRGPIGMMVGFPYSLGIVWFACLGIFVRDWRTLYIATSFPALLLIPVAWLLDESPRWLLQMGRLEEATKIMIKAINRNKCKTIPIDQVEVILKELVAKPEQTKKTSTIKPKMVLKKLHKIIKSFENIVKFPEMRKIAIISPIVWCLNEIVYYGTIFNANKFSSNMPFLYVALTGVADGLAILLGSYTTQYGRKLTIAGSQYASAVLLLLVLAVPNYLKWLQWVLVMVGFLLCALASQALFVYTPELFPTVIRARGFALSNLTGYVGTLVAPFIPMYLSQYGWWVTGAILGGTGFISGTLVMNLIETNHLPLCETIQDVEERKINMLKPAIKNNNNVKGVNGDTEK